MQGQKNITGYVLDEKIGTGSMGEVWRAHDVDTNQVVAIKFLKVDILKKRSREVYIERFLREGKITTGIDHNNIVKVHKAGLEDGTYFIVMEYIDGTSLSDHMKMNKGLLDESEIIEMVIAVSNALKEALASNVIHRDVKPDNILISRDGTVKLADLSFAKKLDCDESLTAKGKIIGTPSYTAPEQILNASNVDHRSDIYSLGATMYHMATGEVPFPGKNPVNVMKNHIHSPVINPKVKNSQLSEDFCKVISKMMQKNHLNRYQNYDSLISDLYQVKDSDAPSKNLHASTENRYDIQSNPKQKYKKIALMASLIFIAILAILILCLAPGSNMNEHSSSTINLNSQP